MSTTSGTMRNLKVTDKDGNIFNMAPVDSEARQAIDEAKNLQFDEDYFTSELSQDESELSIGLNGVPIGVESPLKFIQDDDQGIVIGSDALTQSSADTLYYPKSSNPSGYLTDTDISATSWNSVYDTVCSNSASWTSTPAAQLTAGTDLVISNNIINLNTNGTANSSNKAFVANVATSATGNGAAAFGYNTSAGGDYSFAGGYYTKTNGSAMTVIGRYNRTSANTATLFVVGNGTSDSDRSDAFLVRTDGCRTISRGVEADSAKYYRTIMAPTAVSVFSSDSANNASSFCIMSNNEIIMSATTDDSLDINRHSIELVDNNESIYFTKDSLYFKESDGTVHSIRWKNLIDKVNALT